MADIREIKKGKIANALTSAAKDHIVATTDDLYDMPIGLYQEEINALLSAKTESLEEEIHGLSAATLELSAGTIYEIGNLSATTNTRISELSANTVSAITTLSAVTTNRIDELSAATVSGLTELSAATMAIEENVNTIDSKIPEEASPENQLADKQYVYDLVTKYASFFRGSWANWEEVPTDYNDYPEDIKGNKKPQLDDYIILENASDYDVETGLTGTWVFIYNGEWDTDGKSGWEKGYRINEESEAIVSFYWKYEGDDDADATFITENKVVKGDTLNAYPQLTELEFKDGGYWDTPITELRNVSMDFRVTYIIPSSYRELANNSQLIELCFENGWCASPEYMSTEEMENLTNE